MEHVDYRNPVLHMSLLNEPFYITSLRHPLSRLKSQLNYKYVNSMHKNSREDLLEMFLMKPMSSRSSFLKQFQEKGVHFISVPKDLINDSLKTSRFVKNYLGNMFKFVLITEYLDESLVLMKRKLCWNLKDIIYFRLKKGNYNYKNINIYDKYIQRHKAMMVRN